MPLLYEKHGPVAILTLSRPEARNAWCGDYDARFMKLMPELEDDRDIRCVVLTGDPAGNASSAGADLKSPLIRTHDSVEMTEDKAENDRSWRERRKPEFKGR
jgi:enoyl-CoA hydratase/carnithine racemase